MPRFTLYLRIAILILILPSWLFADTVLLRNGQAIEGKIVGQSRTTVRIRTAGGTRSIPKAKVRRIVYGGGAKAKAERERKKKEREERLKKLREKRKKEKEERERKKAEAEGRKKQEELEALEAARRAEEAERLRLQREAGRGDITLPGALIRSALLPGLGQIYQDRPGAGAGYMAGFLVVAGATGAAIAHHEHTRKQYLATAEDALIYTPFFFDLIAPVSPVNSSTLSRDEFTTFGLFHQMNVAGARAEMVEAGKMADAARTALLTFYLWNLADAFLFHPRGDSNTALGVYFAPEAAGIHFQIRF